MSMKIIRIVGLILALAGLAVLLSNGSLMESAGHAIMARAGGSMDTGIYLAQMLAAGDTYRVLGGVLLAVGLLAALQPGRP
jgi:hypothetical protein